MGRSLPSSINVYTWGSCTIDELALEVADASSSMLPHPAIGTRLVFQHISINDTTDVNRAPHLSPKDLGSVVIGRGGPGTDVDSDPTMERRNRTLPQTLAEARFLEGDYISCAIMAPMPDGSVAPEALAKADIGDHGRSNRYSDGGARGGGRGMHGSKGDWPVQRRGRGGRGNRGVW